MLSVLLMKICGNHSNFKQFDTIKKNFPHNFLENVPQIWTSSFDILDNGKIWSPALPLFPFCDPAHVHENGESNQNAHLGKTDKLMRNSSIFSGESFVGSHRVRKIFRGFVLDENATGGGWKRTCCKAHNDVQVGSGQISGLYASHNLKKGFKYNHTYSNSHGLWPHKNVTNMSEACILITYLNKILKNIF